ncbi:MAG: YebC/PmpR family DNA-binding transcriptional regulator [Acidimicrobiales bacterium]|nr:YebC/PmpR family DNA-binding transcriptional regulator [Acidimicrobiales bacterium]
MSGHSKWATTKYRKGAQDKARAKLFAKLIRQIEVAAREGGNDTTSNATLRTAVSKARDNSVPADTIERAIKRGIGELEGVRYESINYEGYGPSGVAVIVECLSDNRNRTGSEIRSLFSRNGGSMAEPGSVSWQFDRKAVIRFKSDADEETILGELIDSGCEDLSSQENEWLALSPPTDLANLRSAIENSDWTVISADLAMVANQSITLNDEGEVKKVLKLLDALEEHDDAQNVYDNSDIPSEIIEALSSD